MVKKFVDAAEKAGQDRNAVLATFESLQPVNRLGQAQEVASAIVYLASDESSFTTAADIPVDGGFLA